MSFLRLPYRFAAIVALSIVATTSAVEAEPVASSRTVVASIEIDRDAMRVVSYTIKNRPFVDGPQIAAPRAYREGDSVQAEVVLLGPGEQRYTRRVEAGLLCLSHGFGTPPHIQGDTILLHRDAFIVELPELPGFDRVEVAYHDRARGGAVRQLLGTDTLDSARFTPAAGPLTYADLAFASQSTEPPPPAPDIATLLWPEDFSDPDIYRVEGDAAEVGKRINVVLVPDGYRYTEKAVMDAHFDAMVAEFRSVSPYAEHDPFVNYILVYAYSAQSGTDQCDCDIVLDTAMATAFPEAVPTCGDSDNRCLYYEGACEPAAIPNIVAAELRAPAIDSTIIMVNTTRYGGCAGARAVYSAGNPAAQQVGVHELGHSLAGLADEYVSQTGCGTQTGEVNTSDDPINGAWPEWIADIGAPREGAQYYSECIFRPLDDCAMRSLNQPFCPVCKQKWALTFFQHARVQPSAPVSSFAPGTNVVVQPQTPTDFSVTTRLAEGPEVTNEITWRLQGPGFPSETVVATGTENHTQSFPQEGLYTLSAEVIADTNFIKPSEYDANVDTVGWNVFSTFVFPPQEVSPEGGNPLYFANETTLWWEEASGLGVESYNLYRGDVTLLPGGDYGNCLESGLTFPSTQVTEEPPPGVCWTYLIAGVNVAGEGPLGTDSFGGPRLPSTPCP